MAAYVKAVHAKGIHSFSKETVSSITLLAGLGVANDAHCGVTVKHRSRVAKDPTQPNLRQIHFIHHELLDELEAKGFSVLPGQLGENITTTGLPVLDLSAGTTLRIGMQALVQITGLRNPCAQIESFMPGLLAAVLGRTSEGALIRKTGVMGIVLESGIVVPGDPISIVYSPSPAIPRVPV